MECSIECAMTNPSPPSLDVASTPAYALKSLSELNVGEDLHIAKGFHIAEELNLRVPDVEELDLVQDFGSAKRFDIVQEL